MYSNSKEIKFHILTKNSPNFKFGTKFISINRAGIQISTKCPEAMKAVIELAISKEWIEAIAYMSDREMTISGLLKDLP